MGLLSSIGSISSISVLDSVTKLTQTPCSAMAFLGVMAVAPKSSRYICAAASMEGVATPT